MGIGAKCFEILENKPTSAPLSSLDTHPGDIFPGNNDGATGGGYAPLADGDVTDDDDLEEGEIDDEDEAVEAEDDDDDIDTADVWDDDDDDDDFEGEMVGVRRVRLRLREILFYDDKVAVFKARHGRL
jgi:hypothetical protein